MAIQTYIPYLCPLNNRKHRNQSKEKIYGYTAAQAVIRLCKALQEDALPVYVAIGNTGGGFAAQAVPDTAFGR